ncbi:TonB-dependent siderophore receptor [Burkholderia sp. Ax-1719]|uniref:TonB-dependent receptor n=1 Tax=Burkholderia sp. Ax-1719 TaxID=2608334 RepID=UPI001423B62F|nr:TonB-dependent siderophore receptor [Burkholderia sp. Ax-1719]NIE64739.1 TonB-dependent siderophore receptor [Burkholderia sp. Ax-1719]
MSYAAQGLHGRRHRLINALLAAGVIGAIGSLGLTALPALAADAPSDSATRADANAKSDNASSGEKPAADSGQPGQQLAPIKITSGKTQGFAPKSVETGQYRGQDALDVAATVNVVTRDLLDAQGATGLFDAVRNVAGVSRQQLNGLAYDNLSVRGIALDNRSSFYIDGLLPIDNNIWMPMEDKERVEVLKGASALYYGFTVPAGIVNMVMKRAGSDPVTSLSVLGDSNGSIGAAVDIARRFGPDDQFGLRVNAMDEHVETPIEGDRGYRKFVSAAFDWRVNSQLKLQYDLEHIETKIVEQAGIAPLAAVNGVITLPAMPDPSRLLVPNNRPTYASATSQLVRADYTFNDHWSANFSIGQSITRRDRWAWVFQKYNVATGTGTLQGSQQNGQMYENKNVRLEVNGDFKTGPFTHTVTVGGTQNWLFQPDFTTYTYTATQNLYDPIDIAKLTRSATSKAFYAQHVRNSGLYLFDQIDLTSRLQVMGAVRYSQYTSSQAGTPSQNINRTSPSGSITYRLTPNTSVYASYVEALESPGSAPATAANAYQILPAAVSRQEEVGVRTRLPGNTLVSVALFNLRQPSAETNTSNVYTLDGMARYRGLEFSVQGEPVRNVSVSASAMYLDAKTTESSDPTLLGKVPENTPHVTASLFAEYRVPALTGLAVNGGLYYTGPRAVNGANQAWIGGYTIFTAGLRYETRVHGKRVSVQANLENATNKRYWSAAGSNQIAVGLGRTVELSSTIDF